MTVYSEKNITNSPNAIIPLALEYLNHLLLMHVFHKLTEYIHAKRVVHYSSINGNRFNESID